MIAARITEVLRAGSLPANRMNALLTTESPSSPQLFFSFTDERSESADSWKSASRPSNGTSSQAEPRAQSSLESVAEVQNSHRAKHDPSRINKPARIGTVMIKLLKSYGITDAEIQAGLEAYASKHQASLAS
ncbi:MAG: hypothetical protein ACE361_04805 [Aureliella sp.]